MKTSNIILFTIIVGILFFMFNLMLVEVNTQYPDANINESITDGYDYISEINESVAPLQENLNKLGEEQGWLSFLAQGVQAIPRAMITAVSVTFQSIRYSLTLLTKGLKDMGVDGFIISGIIALFSVWFIFKLVSYWRYREEV